MRIRDPAGDIRRMELGLTESIAVFISETDFDRIPKEAVRLAKTTFLDCLGVALAGSREPVSAILQEFLKDVGGEPIATMIGTQISTSCPWAALANGTIAHALDYDDATASHMPFHPSVPVLPTVLALGEKMGASGKQVIEAYIVGLEVETKIASIMSLRHMDRGWHPSGTVGTLGATAAAAKLLHLPPDRISTAFGIAASLAGGLRQNFGTMTKPFHAGKAAHNGVIASILAEKGFTASGNILEEADGFLDIFNDGENCSQDKVIGGLGQPFYLVSPGISIKKYPSCYGTHAALDAIFELVKECEFSYQDVATVECGIRPMTRKALKYDNPTNPLEAKFSMQYCLSIALLDGRIGLEQFDNNKINNPEVQKTIGKVKVYVHPDLVESPVSPAIVTVKLRDRREYSKRVDRPRGNPDKPLTEEELTSKFTDCAKLAISSDQIKTLMEMLTCMEEIEDIRRLVDLAK